MARPPDPVRRHVAFLAIAFVILLGPLIGVLIAGQSPLLGLDLQGGVSVVLAPAPGKPVRTDTLNQAVDIIRQRIDSLGVAEPDVTVQGHNIVVDLPGVKDARAAIKIVGETAELQFRLVLQTLPPAPVTSSTTPTTAAPGASTSSTGPEASSSTTEPSSTSSTGPASTSSTGPASTSSTGPASTSSTETTTQKGVVLGQGSSTSSSTTSSSTTGTTAKAATPVSPTTTTTAPALAAIPTTPNDEDTNTNPQVVLPTKPSAGQTINTSARLKMGPVLLTGKQVSAARSAYESGSGWVVHLSFTDSGFSTFQQVAKADVGKQIAIILDHVVQSYPVIQTPTFNTNDVLISGSFTQGEVESLAAVLKYGALPVTLVNQTTESVSPTLGRDQLRAGVLAGLLGLGLVILYMLFYYRLLGLVILAGLSLSAAALWALTAFLGGQIGLTLSLSGVTGVIVSVGITVDSYVVYFERLKDEVRSGKTIRSSLDRGFARSYRTIVAADLVSLIAAILLYVLSIGSVRGFAFFLGLSTLLDLFVSYFFMHPLVSIIGRKESFRNAGWLGIASGLDAAGATA